MLKFLFKDEEVKKIAEKHGFSAVPWREPTEEEKKLFEEIKIFFGDISVYLQIKNPAWSREVVSGAIFALLLTAIVMADQKQV